MRPADPPPMSKGPVVRRFTATCLTGVLLLATSTLVSGAQGGASTPAVPKLSLGHTSVFSVKGITVAGTPSKYDKVLVRRFGSPSAANVLVLVPGTSGGGGDFDIVGPYLASHVPNLQVWAENRREGALEDNVELLKALHGKVTVQQAFDYYLGWIANPKVTTHYQPLKASEYSFVDQWGLATAMGDLHNVIDLARDGGKRTVILGGHSLGGSEASIYAAWDFNGRPGYKDIAGIIGIDGDAGGSGVGAATSITHHRLGGQCRELTLDQGAMARPVGNGPALEHRSVRRAGCAVRARSRRTQHRQSRRFPCCPRSSKPPAPTSWIKQLPGYNRTRMYAESIPISVPRLRLPGAEWCS